MSVLSLIWEHTHSTTIQWDYFVSGLDIFEIMLRICSTCMIMSISMDASELYHNSNSTRSSKLTALKLEVENLTCRVYIVVFNIESSCWERMSSYPKPLMLQSGLKLSKKFGLQSWRPKGHFFLQYFFNSYFSSLHTQSHLQNSQCA